MVPGHTDPEKDKSVDEGGVRTDAPVAPQAAVHAALATAALNRWQVGSFDIGSAFLTGRKHPRKLCARPPRSGLPNVPDGSLIELLKGSSA